jgi:hypothetical protein
VYDKFWILFYFGRQYPKFNGQLPRRSPPFSPFSHRTYPPSFFQVRGLDVPKKRGNKISSRTVAAFPGPVQQQNQKRTSIIFISVALLRFVANLHQRQNLQFRFPMAAEEEFQA